MLEEHFEELKGNLVEHVIAQVHKNRANGIGANGGREGGKGDVKK